MILIAHRGASGYAPENTLAAFRIALEMGAKAIELDIHETSDKRLVVIHDANLKRTAGSPAGVREVPYTQLSGMDAGKWFAPGFAGERVPLLEEVLALLKDKVELHVEVKEGGTRYPGIERRLLDLLKRAGWMDQAVVSSFDHPTLGRLRELSAKVRLGLLAGGGPQAAPSKAAAAAKELKCESIDCSLGQFDGRWKREARAARMKCNVYTVNEKSEAERLAKLNVDGIFTNFPDLLSTHWQALGGTAE